jgi:hypothetical protein
MVRQTLRKIRVHLVEFVLFFSMAAFVAAEASLLRFLVLGKKLRMSEFLYGLAIFTIAWLVCGVRSRRQSDYLQYHIVPTALRSPERQREDSAA